MAYDIDALLRRRLLWLGIAAGALAFAVPQAALMHTWRGDDPGWFLNSGVAVATICAAIGLAAAILAIQRSQILLGACCVMAGAVTIMTLTLFVIGPGNLFPIAIAIGTGLICIGVAAGTAAGALIGLAAGALWSLGSRTLKSVR